MIFPKKLSLYLAIFISIFNFLEADTCLEKITKIEQIIQKDPGNRGVHHFYTKALVDAVESLYESQHVAILTGFFIPSAQLPETDGPLGSLYLAQTLLALGKQVTIVTDRFCISSVMACFDVIKDKKHSSLLTIHIFPEEKQMQESFVSTLCQTVDCLVSIERVGRSFDGKYRSMRSIDITEKTAPLDDLFLYAQNHPQMHITTIAVGDGGNEIGMGTKIDEVQKHIPHGKLIACTVPADHLIVTGVSNWGGYALGAALQCKNGLSNSLNETYPSIEEQFQMLENMVFYNCCDGVLGKPALSVDGLPWDIHKNILKDIEKVLE